MQWQCLELIPCSGHGQWERIGKPGSSPEGHKALSSSQCSSSVHAPLLKPSVFLLAVGIHPALSKAFHVQGGVKVPASPLFALWLPQLLCQPTKSQREAVCLSLGWVQLSLSQQAELGHPGLCHCILEITSKLWGDIKANHHEWFGLLPLLDQPVHSRRNVWGSLLFMVTSMQKRESFMCAGGNFVISDIC